jgi:hypothetical protein
MPNNSSMQREEVVQAVPRSLREATARLLRAGKRPVHTAFLARGLNALARLAENLEEGALSHAAGAPSDYAVLLYALEEPNVLTVLRRENPLARARLRGLDARTRLLEAEGGPLTVDEVARLLRITRQAVDKRRRVGRLLGLRTGRRGYAYPSWQFSNEGMLSGLEEVLADLHGHDPWTQVGFFLNGNVRLGGKTPLAELRRGHVEAVRRAARVYGEQGAA